jgi:hypothetical protein
MTGYINKCVVHKFVDIDLVMNFVGCWRKSAGNARADIANLCLVNF